MAENGATLSPELVAAKVRNPPISAARCGRREGQLRVANAGIQPLLAIQE
jgi:hypothetical protein